MKRKCMKEKNEVKLKKKSCRALTSASPLAITCTGDALCNGKKSKNNSMAKTTISTICSWWEWLLVITAILFHCFPFIISYFGIFFTEDYKLIFMPNECI